MKISYDYQIFSSQEYGGISRYFYEIATRISKREEFDVKILSPLYFNNYLKDCDSLNVVGRYIPKIPKTVNIIKTLNSVTSRVLLHKRPPDIVHETYYLAKKLSPKNTITVITVYDMIHEKFREFFPLKDITTKIKAQAIKRADHVICISENTKKDLIEILGINSKAISVVYLGNSLKTNTFPIRDNKIIQQPYILYVGLRDRYKNFARLLEAYASSSLLKSNFKLVCFGGGHFSSAELEKIKQLGLDHRTVLQVSGNDNVLANFYTYASAFVCPSLYEGFGIPLLEAMSLRCPVVCSNVSSIPEIAGNAAEYFDPNDIDHIKFSIESVVNSPEKSSTLIALGLERIKDFSWENCAKQTQSIYTSLCR